MARIKINGLKELERRFTLATRLAISKTLRDKILRNDVGLIVENDIRKNFNEKASKVTQDFREYFEQFNKTHPSYRRSKINITFTGELLRDLATNVKGDIKNRQLVIEHSDRKHSSLKDGGNTFKKKTVQVTSLKTKKTRSVEQKKTHKQISEFVQSKGYDYIKVSDEAQDKIIALIEKVLLNNIQKELGVKA